MYDTVKGQGKAKSNKALDLGTREKGGEDLGISDIIAGFIQQELEEAGGALEVQRSDLAQRFNCVPSQINYVMSTRFSPEHGYIVESRRGGGGYIRIVRIVQSGAQQLMYLINERIGDAIGEEEASRLVQQLTEQKLVTAQEAALMRAAMSAQALAIPIPDSMKDAQRARIFKAMLTSIARQNRTMP